MRMSTLFVIEVVAVFCWSVQSGATSVSDDSWLAANETWLNPFLPTSILPVSYTMHMYPDFYHDASTFYGDEQITLDVVQDTDLIILHYKMMSITNTTLFTEDGTPVPLTQVFAYDPHEYWVMQTATRLLTGSKLTLHLHFTGSLINGIVGYYKSTYVHDVTKEQSWLATTKFQPSDARKAFPNFDEPRFKTTFDITLKHWKNFTALANMPAKSFVDVDDVFMETTFETTPLMSSYLVCFIVCDFTYLENTLNNGIPHRVWARPDRISQSEYALWAGPVIQDFFVEEFATPYPLPKLDQFAVPDYPSGATEHWGLITYRDTRLLYDPVQVGDSSKQSTLSLIAHELAHNHVGDLVTCLYWDELWLNEGFATYYAVKGTAFADPSMYYDGQFYTRTVQPVMATDAGNSSRPLIIPINSPDEANAAFDGITYDKGSSMLLMMEGFLGSEVFKRGVSRFLQDNMYGSVVTDDLWRAFQEEIGDSLNITHVMSTWMYSMGYPVVDIVKQSEQRLEAKQKRFMIDPSTDPDSPPSEYGYKWHIPLNYRTRNTGVGLIWMNASDVTFTSPVQSDAEWVIFNHDHSGFYSVNYPVDMWQLIKEELDSDHTVFTDVERCKLLNDAFMVARAGQLIYDVPLGLTTYLPLEADLLPWSTSLTGFDYINLMLYSNYTHRELWQHHVVWVSKPLMDALQVVDQGTHVEKLTRTNMIRLTCGNGETQCLQNTTSLFVDWIADEITNAVATNLRREVYAFGMMETGGEIEWQTVWNRYVVATSGQDKDNLLYSLSRTTDLTLIDRLLNYSMDESKIRAQDFFTVITYCSTNLDANKYTWQWVQNNYEAIVNRFGLSNRSLGRMVPDIVKNYNTESELEEVKAFYAKYPDAGTGERFRQESIQSILANISWVGRSLTDVINWLLNNSQPF